MTAVDVAGHLGDAVLELTARRRASGGEPGTSVVTRPRSPDRTRRSVLSRSERDTRAPSRAPALARHAVPSARARGPAVRRPRRGQDRLRPGPRRGPRHRPGGGVEPDVHPIVQEYARPERRFSTSTSTASAPARGRRSGPRRAERGRRRRRRSSGRTGCHGRSRTRSRSRLEDAGDTRRRITIRRPPRRDAGQPDAALLEAVVRRFLGDDHVVDVALAHAGRRDPRRSCASRPQLRRSCRSRSSPCRPAGRRPAGGPWPPRCPCTARGPRCPRARACRRRRSSSRSNSSWK